MRIIAFLLAITLAGCVAHTPIYNASRTNSSSSSAPPEDVHSPTVPPANQTVTLPPAATFSNAGMYWSDCGFRSATFVHKHEWAAHLVPPEYQQTNLQAGNLGENTLQMFQCASIAIGNQTFIPHVDFGFYAIHVQAPARFRTPTPNYYVLDFLTDAMPLMRSMEAARLPIQRAHFGATPSSYELDNAAFSASVSEPHKDPASGNATWLARLHWKVGTAHCWIDIEAVDTNTEAAEAFLFGIAGAPATVSGPLHRLGGLASHGLENGHMTAPACLAS